MTKWEIMFVNLGKNRKYRQYVYAHLTFHRDIKPANILLRTVGTEPNWKNIDMSDVTVLLADFGLSRFFSSDGSLSMTVTGTPAFMAPEILIAMLKKDPIARYSSKADVYSLGLVMLALYKKGLPGVISTYV